MAWYKHLIRGEGKFNWNRLYWSENVNVKVIDIVLVCIIAVLTLFVIILIVEFLPPIC